MRTVKLCDVANSQYGYTASASDRVIGPKFLRITDIVAPEIVWEDVPHCQIEDRLRDKYLLRAGDIVVARTGATTGYAKLIRDDVDAVFASYLVRFQVHDQAAVPSYVGLLMESKVYKDFVESVKGGAAQPNANAKTLGLFEFSLPSIRVQERIVEIIGVYDNLIENNRRRISVLEDAARHLYKEWFVRFRFPGHEHIPMIDGLPKGWERTTISKLCTVGRGASPRPIQAFLGGTVPWFKIRDATASESPFVFHTAEAIIEKGVQKSVFLGEGELILSNSATCGVPNFTAVSGCIHDGWLHFRDLKQISKYHLYCYLVDARERLLQGIGEGATQKNLNTDYVGRQTICFPACGPILERFEAFAESTFFMIERLARQNLELRKARDLLLPKLMNGTLTV